MRWPIRIVVLILKWVLITLLGLVLSFAMLWYLDSVQSRRDYVEVPLISELSPNGKWLLEVNLYKDYPSETAGVYRIYRTTDRHLEVEFESSHDDIFSGTPPSWFGNLLLFTNDSVDGVTVPANLWVRFITWLP